MGLYTGGLIFGMVRVLVNWWAYTWGLIFGGLRYFNKWVGALIRAWALIRGNTVVSTGRMAQTRLNDCIYSQLKSILSLDNASITYDSVYKQV